MPESGGNAAGASTREQAAKAAASVADAERRLSSAQRRQRAWEAGAEGERRTGEVLKALEPHGWRLLHDLHWPGRPFANIDHIAVGPGGVFVIDSKNWSGRIEVRDGVLRQNGYRRTETCKGAASAAAAIAAIVAPQYRTAVRALLCLVEQPTPSQQPVDVGVFGLDNLSAHLRGQPDRLSPQDVRLIMARLGNLLTGERSPAQMTTAALSERPFAERSATPHPTRAARPRPTRRAPLNAPTFPRTPGASALARRNQPGVSKLKLAMMALLILFVLPGLLQAIGRSGPLVPAGPSPMGYRTPATAQSSP